MRSLQRQTQDLYFSVKTMGYDGIDEVSQYDRTFKPIEGMQVWVDVEPELDDYGELILDEDGNPTVMPDYTLKRLVDTKMGTVARYLIHKNGDEVGEYHGDND